MRLAKFLSNSGVASRRKSEDIIREGRVKVNGAKVVDPAKDVNEEDKIDVDGKTLDASEKVYYLLNKPIGYTSTASDKYADHVITELVPPAPKVWPAGRLDKNTSGLIILTNDGELTQKITHPSFEKTKEYVIVVDRPLSDIEILKLKKGIILEDGPFRPDDFSVLSQGKYLIKIHEGRNRLVRRSIEHFGKNITKLERTKIGILGINNLKVGHFRKLTAKDLKGFDNA